MPLVSVIMPVFNGEAYLAEAIESILEQTFADFELLVVDDGSRDRSVEIIRAYSKRDDRIRAYQHARNLGMAAARNRGLAAASGKYITGMDCDDVSLPERLRKQVNFLDANPEIGAIGTCAYIVDEDLKRPADYIVPTEHASIVMSFFVGRPFTCATVMMRRKAYELVGLFNDALFYVDDIEIMWRAVAKVKCANLPDRLLLWRRHAGATGYTLGDRRAAMAGQVRANMLKDLWNEAPDKTMQRFERLRSFEKLGWYERRLAERDMKRVIDALVARSYVDPGDRATLYSYVERRLEGMTPRLWQMFCHWRRHHFGRMR